MVAFISSLWIINNGTSGWNTVLTDLSLVYIWWANDSLVYNKNNTILESISGLLQWPREQDLKKSKNGT